MAGFGRFVVDGLPRSGDLRVTFVHAITMAGPGDAAVLRWTEVADPTPGAGEVVVAVRAAGLNRADLSQRAGHYPPPPGASAILGLECSGRIVAVGPGVSGWGVGDDVCALLAGGGYAERVAVPAGQLLPIPAGVQVVDAAGLPEAACTVWSTVFQAARVRAGETLLVHGGTSGIGTFAIQLARALGVRVFTTAGTPDKCARAVTLGAELAIDYRRDDFVAAIHSYTGRGGVDVILDVVGGEYLGRNLDALAPDGRLVVLAMQRGRQAELDLALLMSKRGTVYSAGLRARPLSQKAAIVAAVRASVWPLIESGAVRVVVQAEVPMPDAADAHRLMEAGDHVGKILLTLPETMTA
jgi:putative PIG3 family NAD(P)H quinone oxidoreductase